VSEARHAQHLKMTCGHHPRYGRWLRPR